MTRIFALILVFGAAACGHDAASENPADGGTTGSTGDANDTTQTPSNSNITYTGPQIAYKGRFVADASSSTVMDCAWSGCAVETRFTGTSVSIGLASASNANIYFDVSVDGGAPTKLKLSSGVDRYTVLSPAPKQAHTVRWTKISEASYGSVSFEAPLPSSDGALMPTQTPTTRTIEFIGDSITAGYGVLGADYTCTGSAENEDADAAYPALVGAAFGADYMQLGFSGRGMSYNADCTTAGLVPSLYSYAIPPGTQNATAVSWDASQFTPAVIVVNIGTNDFSAALGQGSCNTSGAATNPGFPDQATYESAYEAFLQTLSTTHPDAYILVVYGPMLSDATSGQDQVSIDAGYLQDVLSSLDNDKISLLKVGPQGTAKGCDYHPNAATHAQVAQAIETAIAALPLGWTL
jgi:lysophospholipase L1-like esterase